MWVRGEVAEEGSRSQRKGRSRRGGRSPDPATTPSSVGTARFVFDAVRSHKRLHCWILLFRLCRGFQPSGLHGFRCPPPSKRASFHGSPCVSAGPSVDSKAFSLLFSTCFYALPPDFVWVGGIRCSKSNNGLKLLTLIPPPPSLSTVKQRKRLCWSSRPTGRLSSSTIRATQKAEGRNGNETWSFQWGSNHPLIWPM